MTDKICLLGQLEKRGKKWVCSGLCNPLSVYEKANKTRGLKNKIMGKGYGPMVEYMLCKQKVLLAIPMVIEAYG